jgi:hypothetical protein
MLHRPRKTTAMEINLTALNAGVSAVVRLGIHADAAGRPGNVAIDAGTASINSNGFKTLTYSEVLLMPGDYWAVLVPQSIDTAGVNPAFAGIAASTSASGDPAPTTGGNPFSYLTAAVSGALANNPTVTVVRASVAKAFHIYMKVTG